MAVALKKSFTARTNADWAEDLQLVANGAPVDLSGTVPVMSVSDESGNLVLALSVGHGLVFDPLAGLLAIRVSASQMQGLPSGSYRHDIQFRQGGAITVPIEGTLVVQRGVTRV
jgi:hypothetical protein